MLIKIHISEKRKIVSICDENLVGKKFGENDLQLDVSKYFYNGKQMEEKEILSEVKDADSLNIVGEKSTGFAIKNKLIEKANIIKIKKIPHAITILK